MVILKLNDDKKPRIIKQPEVGQLPSELRLSTGLTQEKFAAKLGVTYPTVNRWERGGRSPRYVHFGTRCKLFLRRLSKPLIYGCFRSRTVAVTNNDKVAKKAH